MIASDMFEVCLIYADIQICQTLGFQALRDTATYGEAFIQEVS